jgi:hypothetical protein
MKKIMILAVMMLVSCTHPSPDDTIIRISDLKIRVENAVGENLLDLATVGNILDNEIFIEKTFGRNFEKICEVGGGFSGGFQLKMDQSEDNIPVLIFTIPVNSNGSMLFMIHWGDGTSDELKITVYDDGKDEKKGIDLWFDGELCHKASGLFTIVK